MIGWLAVFVAGAILCALYGLLAAAVLADEKAQEDYDNRRLDRLIAPHLEAESALFKIGNVQQWQ